ncbi:hypothetical protein AAHC03_04437 [Spirometra sp. Aus1]
MRNLLVTLLLWFFACPIFSNDISSQTESSATAVTLVAAEHEGIVGGTSDSIKASGTESGVTDSTMLCKPCNIVEGVINYPPLEQTQETLFTSTPASQSSLPAVEDVPGGEVTSAQVDFSTQLTPDATSEGARYSPAQTPLTSTTEQPADTSHPSPETARGEVVQSETPQTSESEIPGSLREVSTEVTTAQRSETESTFALLASTQRLTTEQPEGAPSVDVAKEGPPTVGITQTTTEGHVPTTLGGTVASTAADSVVGSTTPLLHPAVSTVQEASDRVSTDDQAILTQPTTLVLAPLSEGTSEAPKMTTLSVSSQMHSSLTPTSELVDTVTTVLVDNVATTGLPEGSDPQLSLSTDADSLVSQTTASVYSVGPLTQQPATKTTDGPSPLTYTQEETEFDHSAATTPAATGSPSSLQMSVISTGADEVTTDYPSLPATNSHPTTVASDPLLSYTDVPTTVQEVVYFQSADTSSPHPAASTPTPTTLEMMPPLSTTKKDFEGSPSLAMTHSIFMTSTSAMTELLPSSPVTKTESYVSGTYEQTLSPTPESKVTDHIPQDTTQQSYVSTSVQPPEKDTVTPIFITTAGVPSAGPAIQETGSFSQFTEILQPTMLSTTPKSPQDTTFVLGVHETFTKASTVDVTTGYTEMPSSSVTAGPVSESPTGGSDAERSTKLEPPLPTTQSILTFSPESTTMGMTSSTPKVTVDFTSAYTEMPSSSVTAGPGSESPTEGTDAERSTIPEPFLPATPITSTFSSKPTTMDMTSSIPIVPSFSSPGSATDNLTQVISSSSVTEMPVSVTPSGVTLPPSVKTQLTVTSTSVPLSTVSLSQSDTTLLTSSSETVFMTSTADKETISDTSASLMMTTVSPAFPVSQSAISETTLKPTDVSSQAVDSSPSSSIGPSFLSSTVIPISSTTVTSTAAVTAVEQQRSSTSVTPPSASQSVEPQMINETPTTSPTLSTVKPTETAVFTSVSQTSTIATEVTTSAIGAEITVVSQISQIPDGAEEVHTAHTALPTSAAPATEQGITTEVASIVTMKTEPAGSVGPTEGLTQMVETSSSTTAPIPQPPTSTDTSEITSTDRLYPSVAPAISRGLSIASAVSMGLIIIFVSILLCVFAVSAVGGWLEYRKRKRSRRPPAVNLVRVERGGSEDFTEGWTKGKRQQQQQQAWMTCESAALKPHTSAARQEPLGKLARQCSCKRRRLLFPGKHHSLCMLHSEVKPTEEPRALRVISLSDEDEEAISSESMLLSGIGRRRVSGASEAALAEEQANEKKSTGKNSPIVETEDGDTGDSKTKWLFIDEV